MEEQSKLKDLAKCLSEASNICSDMVSKSSCSDSSRSLIPSSSHHVRAATDGIASAVSRARAMVQASTQSGQSRRMNQRERLRASSTPKRVGGKKCAYEKPAEIKVFEFVLINTKMEDGDPDNSTTCSTVTKSQYVLKEEIVSLRGFVEISTKASEEEIRHEIVKAVTSKFPLVSSGDIEFLNRRRLVKPISSVGFHYPQVKLLAGQGAIYIKLTDEMEFLFDSNVEEPANEDELMISAFDALPQTCTSTNISE